MECARHAGASVMVRGLRNVADFEFEQQIGWANSQIAPDVELCCLFCNDSYAFLSATILKEIASLGGDVDNWAPAHVLAALAAKSIPDAGLAWVRFESLRRARGSSRIMSERTSESQCARPTNIAAEQRLEDKPQQKGRGPIAILQLVDQLANLIHQGRPIPFTHRCG